MNKPFFSVVIPAYNRETVISRAVSSILNQSFQNWELVLIDDGSTDNTKDVIAGYKDARIKYHYQVNQERSVARNNGIKLSSGNYICFLDSDDEYYTNYLELLYLELEKNDFPVGLIKCIPLIRRNKNNEQVFDQDFENNDDSIEHFLTTYSPLCAISGHSALFKKYTFDPSLKYAEDTNLWMRILTEYRLYNFKIRSCIIYLNTNETMRHEAIHWEYIRSFKKTFSINEIKSLVPQKIVTGLIKKRLQWIKAECRAYKNVPGYLRAATKLQLLKFGIF